MSEQICTIVRLSGPIEGSLVVTIEKRAFSPRKRYGRLLAPPWEHIHHMPARITEESVFEAVRMAVHALAGDDPLPPA